jgi:oligosaccharide repeat unit polymerase
MRLVTEKGYDQWGGGNAAFVARGYCASLLSFVTLLWGIQLAGVRPLQGSPRRDSGMDRSLATSALIFALGSLALVGFGVALVGPSTVFGIYQDWWDAKALGADQRFIDIGLVFSFSSVFALIATDEPGARWRRWFAYVAALIVATMAVQKGDRSVLIALGIGTGWCYTQRIGRLRWVTVLAAATVAMVFMPVIVEWRAHRSVEESRNTSAYELLGKSIYSMGSSANALVFTLEFIPATRGYHWGGTFRHTLLTGIPNFGLSKGKEWARGSIEDTPSNWLSRIISPGWYARGGGYGYSMAAEWYYNFGFPGLVLGMTLVGWGLARARNASFRSSLALVWSACLFAGVAVWVRNTSGTPFKVAVWPVIGLFVIDRLLRLLRGRSRRSRVPVAATLPSP